jgi:hypothetical protein
MEQSAYFSGVMVNVLLNFVPLVKASFTVTVAPVFENKYR